MQTSRCRIERSGRALNVSLSTTCTEPKHEGDVAFWFDPDPIAREQLLRQLADSVRRAMMLTDSAAPVGEPFAIAARTLADYLAPARCPDCQARLSRAVAS